MTRSLQLDRRAFLKGLGRSRAGAARSRRHGRRSDGPDSAPLLRDLHRQRHVAPEDRARHQRVELVSRPRSANGEFVFGKSTEPLEPVPQASSASWAACTTPTVPRPTRTSAPTCG